jgi:DNA-binding transcriptional MerR regulator
VDFKALMGNAIVVLLEFMDRIRNLQVTTRSSMPIANPQNVQGYLIGQAALHSGISAANIRFYEKEGLIPARGAGDNQYRSYSAADIAQLRFIRRLRSLDMSLDEVRSLLHLDLRKKADCQTARDTLDGHINHVRVRLAELRSLEKELSSLRQRCDGTAAQCHIIEALHQQASTAQIPIPRKRRASHL